MRLLHRFRKHRRPAPSTGRHSRPLPSPSVPGAAASLVSTAAEAAGADLAAQQRQATPAHPAALPPDDTHLGPGVILGFADGASVELEADDPRAWQLQAAAAALLDPPRR